METLQKVCEYINTSNNHITVAYDNQYESVLILNDNILSYYMINEVKNMNTDMLAHIARDFKEFTYINHEILYATEDDLEYIKENIACYKEFLQALKNENVEIRK